MNTDLIGHRGPDGAGQIRVDGWSLGHTRLAIQDLSSASAQPWVEGPVTLTYNGELWRPGLLRDGTERTSGDTELVARALARADDPMVALRGLHGMFALAWFDDRDGTLRLARDRFGEVPLHAGFTKRREPLWCSEVGPLIEAGAVPSSVQWVQPGSLIEFGPDGIRSRQWAETFAVPCDADPVVAVREALADGVRDRLVGDVEPAFLLSGGLDSASICALAAIPKATAYVARHYERATDLRHARLIADRLDLRLVEVDVPAPSSADLHDVVRVIEMPHKAQVEIGWACLHLARRAAADGVKVLLSGEGSDELFASYGMAYHGIQQHGWEGHRRRSFVGQHRKNFARTNKVFMRHGVEVRLPFLDPMLVAVGLGLTEEQVRVVDGRAHVKAVLAAGVEDLIGAGSAWRSKQAFQTNARLDKAAAGAVVNPVKFYRAAFRSEFGEVDV